MDDRNRKPNEKPNPLPFLSPKPSPKPSTRVHTSETTINGKTYETITVETPYGSTTTTKEKKPKTAEQWEKERKATDIILLVTAICFVILIFIGFLKRRGLL